jgi:ankyrin repeat protein
MAPAHNRGAASEGHQAGAQQTVVPASTDHDGLMALHHAVIRSDLCELKGLLQSGAALDAVSAGGLTALHLAAMSGQEARRGRYCRRALQWTLRA